MTYSQAWLEDSTRARGLLVVAKRKIAPSVEPTLFMDFVSSTTLDERITFTRSSVATYFDNKGVLQTAAANVPRFDHDPDILQPLGLLVEANRTNYVRNNTMVGTVTGTPGTLPTGWVRFGLSGYTQTVVGTGVDKGISYVDIRLNGTTAAGGNIAIELENKLNLLFTAGSLITGSVWCARIDDGSVGNISSVSIRLLSYNSSNAYVAPEQGVVMPLTNKLTRYSNTAYAIAATADKAVFMVSVNVAAAGPIDITLRIGMPQLEAVATGSTFASSVIPTSTAAVSRAAEVALVNTLTPWFNNTEYTLYYEGMIKQNVTSMTFIGVGDTFDNTSYISQQAAGQIAGSVRSANIGSFSNATTVIPTTGLPFQAALAAKLNFFHMGVNGTVTTTDTLGAMPLSTLRFAIGNAAWNAGGGNQGQQWVQKIGFYPTAFSTAELQTLTGLEDTLYLSNMGFMTTDANTVFNPVVVRDLTLSESISLDGSISVSYGDVELSNTNGELDDWLDYTKYIWSNRPIQIYYGDPNWTLDTIGNIGTIFELVYDGVIDECKSRNRNAVNLILRDKQERFNGPVTENTIGTTGTWAGGQTNQDNIRPIILGEVHNISPILIDPSTLKYLFNDGPCEGLIEIRDNGYPIHNSTLTGAIVDNATGTFTLLAPAAGTITCSVQGVGSTYTNSVTDIIPLLATGYGQPAKRFLPGEIDYSSFSGFTFENDPACGYAVLDRENLLELMQSLARSIGAQVYVNRKGLLQLLRLGTSFVNPAINTITPSDMFNGSFGISNKTDTLGSIKLAYCKNWTLQSSLATSIPDVSKQSFSTEWLLETVRDTLVISTYKLTSDPVQRDSYLVTTGAANEEATRLLSYFKVARTVYSFTGTTKLLGLKLGQAVTLTHPRFGLQAGKSGQVISLSPNWTKGSVEVEVII